MKTRMAISIALALGGLPAVAVAQVTQAYQYDANGRLTGVITSGAGGVHTSSYTYDDANNRTYRSQTGTAAYAAMLENLGDLLGSDPALALAATELRRAAASLRLIRPDDPFTTVVSSTPMPAQEQAYPPALSAPRRPNPADEPGQ